MKILIASDLHGSTTCIEKLVERINKESPEEVLLLGDILYHGPRNNLPSEYDTEKAANIINKKSDLITCVRGNCDSEADETLLEFDITTPHIIMSVDNLNFFVSHGHYYNIDHLPAISTFDILLGGHTHIPAFEEIQKGKYYVNPGSVSIPKGGSENSYIIYENRKFVWKNLDGKAIMENELL